MKDFLQYVLCEAKNERVTKTDAIDLIRQFKTRTKSEQSRFLHPLLHQNTSDFSEQRFSSTFTGREFFLASHKVKGKKVLPGVASLEMARKAVEQASGILKGNQTAVRLKNVVWTRPVIAENQPVQVHIRVFPEANGEITYEIYSQSTVEGVEPVVHCQGTAVLNTVVEAPTLDLRSLKAKCSQSIFNSSQIYEMFRAMGLDYGPEHQGIEFMHVGANQVLAKLSLPSTVFTSGDEFVLHPSLMDSALQASVGLLLDSEIQRNSVVDKPFLPFALQELEIFSSCTPAMWALIRYSSGSKFGDKIQKLDIDLCDEQGKICVQMKGFSSRMLEGEENSVNFAANNEMLLLEPCWREEVITEENVTPKYDQHVVILCEMEESFENCIVANIDGVRCFKLQSNQDNIAERFTNYAAQVFEEIQSIIKNKTKNSVLIQIVNSPCPEQYFCSGLTAMLRTARLENPKLIGQLIEVSAGEEPEKIVSHLKDNSRIPEDVHIRYQDGKRLVSRWSEAKTFQEVAEVPWKDKGVYLITGGAGGLGFIFSREIADKVKDATLILTGRSLLNGKKQDQLHELAAKGIRVEYKQVDVNDLQSVERLIQSIQEEHGNLNGIIHSAGVIRDNYILKKNKEEFLEVLAPKVTGLVNLDQASRGVNLDFFVLFSSTSANFGNLGQCDYATANAFMDTYAKYRNILAASKQCQGQTLSINWPLWQDGGMHVDIETEKMMRQNIGMIAMRTSSGIQAFVQALAIGKSQIMVAEGDCARLRQRLVVAEIPVTSQPKKMRSDLPMGDDSLLEKVQISLVQDVSKLLEVKIENIDVYTELNEYGFDSITFTEFTNQLNRKYQLELVPTIFFEHSTFHSFAKYLIEEYYEVLAAEFSMPIKNETAIQVQTIEDVIIANPNYSKHHTRFAEKLRLSSVTQDRNVFEPVAIIGMSGSFPGARDLDEFWLNLYDGKDCITEIPQERWDWQSYYGDPNKEANKTNIKWGGFIQGIDEFDPIFFGISPREAELMDPQQRLLMTYIWKVVEDAGIAAGSLSGTKTGIFVGTASSSYSELVSQAKIAIEGYSATGMAPSVGPNRMSYFLNTHGPSEPIETACSSSLVAIHRAVSAIRDGSCEMAIVGGVNTIVTPNLHISFSKAGMLCEDGRCKTFSDKANGYVRGEGVGMLFLKKLTAAEQAGDHIYGVIRGTAENHGGRANSLTAPNPRAQAELLVTAYSKAGIDPRTVSYIETHGTGTELGDPIEINGLKAAFSELYQATGNSQVTNAHCGLGSVKTNIGHLELAAGIAGVIKVLLQFKHRKLVKSLHCDTINPYIQLKDSPFYIVRETQEWKSLQGTGGQDLPRRAGVSSFGFGGVNAHVVFEEYIPQHQEPSLWMITPQNPVMIVLSAKNEERLKERAQQLLTTINERQFSDSNLIEIAYTLQVGREAMEERIAMFVSSIKELDEKLTGFVVGREGMDTIYRGQIKRNKEVLNVFVADEDMALIIDSWITKGKHEKLLDAWVKGVNFDWNKLYGDAKPRRISLPAYPFARERYWVPKVVAQFSEDKTTTSIIATSLHPLLHQNTSNFSEQRFSSTFTGQEFFLADHVVKGQRVLPGVASLEIARVAVAQAAGILEDGQSAIRLKNIIWVCPIVAGDEPVRVHIRLTPEENGEIAYEIYSKPKASNAAPVVYSQGRAVLEPIAQFPSLDLQTLQAECSQNIISSKQCYEIFTAMGFDYGPRNRGIEQIYVGTGQVLAKLSLPSSISDTVSQYVLHPSMIDAAVQASIGLLVGSQGLGEVNKDNKPFLPFALQEMEIISRCTSTMWAFIRYSSDSKVGDKVRKLDIKICNASGEVCASMKGFSSRVLEERKSPATVVKDYGTLMLQPYWKEQSITERTIAPEYNQHIVILCETSKLFRESIVFQMDGARCINLQSRQENIAERFQTYAAQIFEEIQNIIRNKPQGKVLIQIVTSMHAEQQLFSALAQLLKTVQLENPKIIGQLIEIDSDEDLQGIVAQLKENSFTPFDNQIRYQDGKRWVTRWSEIEVSQTILECPWKDKGIYLITGGIGGLGLIISREITKKVQGATLILTGRSPLSEEKQVKLKSLEGKGNRFIYKQIDVTDKAAVENLIKDIQVEFKGINGIIHSAGIIQDNFILKKNRYEFLEVLAPKVSGLVNLDHASKELSLDFFVFFSSMAGVLGNSGQADYSTANAFMDAYAKYRNELVVSKLRKGQTLSINWPLWKDGGMRINEENENMLLQRTGMIAMQTSTGIQALYQALAVGVYQVMVAEGDITQMRTKLSLKPTAAPSDITEQQSLRINGVAKKYIELPKEVNIKDRIIAYLKQIISDTLKINVEKIDINASLDKYGLDSIIVLEINNKLEKYFSDLSKTLFFEYSTINDLATYFIESHKEDVIKIFPVEEQSISICQEKETASPNCSKLNRIEYLSKKQLDDSVTVAPNNNPFDSKVYPMEAGFNQIKQSSLLLDYMINNLQLKIIHPKQDLGKEIDFGKESNPPQIRLSKEKEEPKVYFPFESFAPLEKEIEGFSFSRIFTKPLECIEDVRYFIEKQTELRKVLFYKENFKEITKVIDIGCGIATDLIDIAQLNTDIVAHGLTISDEEAKYAEKLIHEKKLENRIKIFCEDNTKHKFEGTYNIVFGIQVMHFINEIAQKNILLKKIASAINMNGKVLLAEYICNLKNPIQDSFLNVTVHTANDWVQLLSNNNLIIDEIIDASSEIKNFLTDNDFEQNTSNLDEDRRSHLKKFKNQVISFQKGWISYCLIKIVKNNENMSVQEIMEINAERMKSKRLYKDVKKEMVEIESSITYRSSHSHFQDFFSGLSNSLQKECEEKKSLLIHEKELEDNPEIAAIIKGVDSKYMPAGYERLLYPYFFISSNKDKYLRVSIDQPNKLIIPCLPIDRDIYQELLCYSQEVKQQLLIVDCYHDWIDSKQFKLIPLGAVQNLDINHFRLVGNKMRKLRYLVEKFKKSGEVKIEEYNATLNLPLNEMRELMLKWSEGKKNVIYHSFVCMKDLLQKTLPSGHRAFLTYHNKKLCSIIVIEKGDDGIYLMDQEFYAPKTATLGHMEYSIVGIIDRLKKEDAKIFSLGLTWYPFIFDDNSQKDSKGWEWLKEQNTKQTLLSRVFIQGETNYQFKKKFGVIGEPVFAYLPKASPFSILLNYWPVFYQNALNFAQLTEQINKIVLFDSSARKESEDDNQLKPNLDKSGRLQLLATVNKLEQLEYNDNPLDLISDSWFIVQSDAVKKRTAYLKTKPRCGTIEILRDIFPFKHIILTERGQIAEQLFYQAYSKEKKKILTTIPWTTTLMHQLNNGFDVIELPGFSVKQSKSTKIFKGEIDIEALEEQIQQDNNNIAMAGLEVLSNASGGHPVRLSHIYLLKTMLQKYQIPLVLDASRIVRNAFLIKQYEDTYNQNTIWDIVKQTSCQAEHIVTSLTKDFAVPIGGLIATNNDQLANEIRMIQSHAGKTITTDAESMIIQAISEQTTIIDLITRQLAFVKRLQDMLILSNVPILQPAYGHAIVIDISHLIDGETNAQKKEQFLRTLFLETGIRGSFHQVGKQKNTILDQCIRLALPLNLTEEDEQSIYYRLYDFFRNKKKLDYDKQIMEVTAHHE